MDLLRDGVAVLGLLLALIFPWNEHFTATDGPTGLVVPAFLFVVAAALVVLASAIVSLGWTTVAPGGTGLRTARVVATAPAALFGAGVMLWDVIIAVIHVDEWVLHNAGVGMGVWGGFIAFVASAQPRSYDHASADDDIRWRKITAALAWIAVGASLLALVRLMAGGLILLVNEDWSPRFGEEQTVVTFLAAPLTVLPGLVTTLVVAFGLTRRDPSLRLTGLAISLGLLIGGALRFELDGTPEIFGFSHYGIGLLVAATVAGLGHPVFTGPDAHAPGRTWLRAGRSAALWIAVLSVAELVAMVGWGLGAGWSTINSLTSAVILCVLSALLAGIAALVWWPGGPRQALPSRPLVLPLLGIGTFMTFLRLMNDRDEYGLSTTFITTAMVVVGLVTILALVTVPSVRAEYAAARPPAGGGPYGHPSNPYASQPYPVQAGHPMYEAGRQGSVPAYPVAAPVHTGSGQHAPGQQDVDRVSSTQVIPAAPVEGSATSGADATVVVPEPAAFPAGQGADATVVADPAASAGERSDATVIAPGAPEPTAGQVSGAHPMPATSGPHPVQATPTTSGSHQVASPYPGAHPIAAPPYGRSPYGPSGAPARPAGTNGMAIASLITSFLVAPLGIIFGHIALSQIKRRREEGRGLAIAGLVIGYLYTISAAATAFVVFVVIGQFTSSLEAYDDYDSGYYSTSTTRYPTSTPRTTAPAAYDDPTAQTILDARVGTCINRVVGGDLGNGISEVTVNPATCGSSYSTHKVVSRTEDIDDCGSKPWVRTDSATSITGWVVLCLRLD